ncbi:hypothetical protein B296_00025534 [Ensete ventricosum]|uniref:Peptidase A2 domain-containing protein n=1 Tax=Ensete ventricosum TaxID=4639 RepID=A0A426Y3J7_ENSVE|nr:hypothetical protein B296_00025534 [Ensete ventricosum]
MSQECLFGNSGAEHRTEPNHPQQAEEVTTAGPTPNRFWRMITDPGFPSPASSPIPFVVTAEAFLGLTNQVLLVTDRATVNDRDATAGEPIHCRQDIGGRQARRVKASPGGTAPRTPLGTTKEENATTYNIKLKTSSDMGTCVGMFATNLHSPIVGLLEIHCPDPRVQLKSKSTSSSGGQLRVATAPWRARLMHAQVGKRPTHDEDLNITFRSGSKEYLCHDDALVISIRMANVYVKRVMIDTGSLIDILYFDFFQKLGLTDKDLITLTSTLTGFTRDFISPMGAATIPITFGGEPRSKTLMVSFMVVKLPSAYNAIIGGSTLN